MGSVFFLYGKMGNRASFFLLAPILKSDGKIFSHRDVHKIRVLYILQPTNLQDTCIIVETHKERGGTNSWRRRHG